MCKKSSFTITELITTLCAIVAVIVLASPFFNHTSRDEKFALLLKHVNESLSKTVKEYDNHASQWGWLDNTVGEASEHIMKKYIIPSFKQHTRCSSNSLLCVGGFLSADGEDYTNFKQDEEISRTLITSNIHLALKATEKCDANNPNSLCGILYVDLDNKDGENQIGRDVFVFGFYGQNGFGPLGYNLPYETIKKECHKNSTSYYCAAKIMHDDWKIIKTGEDKYPYF